MIGRVAEEWAVFRHALQFMTRLPIKVAYSENQMAASPRWYPGVGIIVGAFGAIVFWTAMLVFPQAVAAVLALAAVIIATGALHEDGFADCCDGLGGGVTRELALEIMRDSRVGAYAVVGIVVLLGLKAVLLATSAPAVVPVAFVAAHGVSRGFVTLVIATSSYAREDGAGTSVSKSTGSLPVAAALSAGALFPVAVVAGPIAALIGLICAAGAFALMRRVFERRLGGYTGDCLGAVQQVCEVAFFLGLIAAL